MIASRVFFPWWSRLEIWIDLTGKLKRDLQNCFCEPRCEAG